MRLLITTCCFLLLPALALAQFPGYGQPDAKTPTFNGSAADGKWKSSSTSRLETGPAIATPPSGRGGPAVSVPPPVGSPRPQIGVGTGGSRRTGRSQPSDGGGSGGGSCPRQSSFVGPLIR